MGGGLTRDYMEPLGPCFTQETDHNRRGRVKNSDLALLYYIWIILHMFQLSRAERWAFLRRPYWFDSITQAFMCCCGAVFCWRQQILTTRFSSNLSPAPCRHVCSRSIMTSPMPRGSPATHDHRENLHDLLVLIETLIERTANAQQEAVRKLEGLKRTYKHFYCCEFLFNFNLLF